MSTETVQRAAEAATKIAELQKEREQLLKSADAHETAARADRLRASECKREIGEWTTALNAHRTQHAVETASTAALKAQAEAEKHAADLEKLKTDQAVEVERAKKLNDALDAKLKSLETQKTGPTE